MAAFLFVKQIIKFLIKKAASSAAFLFSILRLHLTNHRHLLRLDY